MSLLFSFHSAFSDITSTSGYTATMTTAASAALGRGCMRGVKKNNVRAIRVAVISPAIWEVAAASLLIAVRDRLAEMGKAEKEGAQG